MLKEGFHKNKDIAEIIKQNSIALLSIDSLIDNDIKKNLSNFNPDINNQLRMKLLGVNVCFFPKRDEKFERVLNSFIESKQMLIQMNKMRENENKDESFSFEQEEEVLFKDENILVNDFMKKRK